MAAATVSRRWSKRVLFVLPKRRHALGRSHWTPRGGPLAYMPPHAGNRPRRAGCSSALPPILGAAHDTTWSASARLWWRGRRARGQRRKATNPSGASTHDEGAMALACCLAPAAGDSETAPTSLKILPLSPSHVLNTFPSSDEVAPALPPAFWDSHWRPLLRPPYRYIRPAPSSGLDHTTLVLLTSLPLRGCPGYKRLGLTPARASTWGCG